jgi:hypothetical protein
MEPPRPWVAGGNSRMTSELNSRREGSPLPLAIDQPQQLIHDGGGDVVEGLGRRRQSACGPRGPSETP